MHFARTVVDTEAADVLVDAHDDSLAGDAPSTKYLHTAIDDPARSLGHQHLGAARFEICLFALIQHPGTVLDREARLIVDALTRLHREAESNLEIRGRWSSREEPLDELLSLVTPQEKVQFEGAIARILKDLPKTYQALLDGALCGVHI